MNNQSINNQSINNQSIIQNNNNLNYNSNDNENIKNKLGSVCSILDKHRIQQ